MMEKIKTVATDVDGTLTIDRNNYRLSLEATKAIRLLEQYGISVILISGNALPIIVALSRYMGTSGPVLGENGCIIYYNGRNIPVALESAEKAAKLIEMKCSKYVKTSW